MPRIIVTEEDWLEKGLENFARSGAEGLVIEKMSGELGCSKSSFYWYFPSRSVFIKRMVEKWVDRTTREVMQASSGEGTPAEQINRLLVQMFSVTGKGDFLFYLRRLASQEPAYQTIIDQVEEQRMRFASELLRRWGMPEKAALHKSSFLYHYYLGWYERHKQAELTEDEVNVHIEAIRKHLLGL